MPRVAKPAPRVRVLVVEGEWQLREAFAKILGETDEFETRFAETLPELLSPTSKGWADVALVDHGVAEPPQIGSERYDPEVAVIALTRSRDLDEFRRALAAGARGYLLKDRIQDGAEVVHAVRTVAAGGTYFSDESQDMLAAMAHEPIHRADPHGLTSREREVLALVAAGLSNKTIALRLSITEQAAKNHVGRILRKLNVVNRTEAALLAVRRGLVDVEPDEAGDEPGHAASKSIGRFVTSASSQIS